MWRVLQRLRSIRGVLGWAIIIGAVICIIYYRRVNDDPKDIKEKTTPEKPRVVKMTAEEISEREAKDAKINKLLKRLIIISIIVVVFAIIMANI